MNQDDENETDGYSPYKTEGKIPAVRCGFGLEELREGFFDAIYAPVSFIEKLAYESVAQECDTVSKTEPQYSSFSVSSFRNIPVHFFKKVKNIVHQLMGIDDAVKLFKAFVAFFIAYIICLSTVAGDWLGDYRYFFALATVLHQAGHSSGSQIEILAQTTVGVALGTGIGALSVYVSTSTESARNGYGGLLALSLSTVTFLSAWVRASYIRLYHGMLAFQISLILATVPDVSADPRWERIRNLVVPYILGIALSCAVNLIMIPDFFHTHVVTSFSEVIEQCKNSIETISQADPDAQSHQIEVLDKLSHSLSVVIREMLNEITISTFSNKQAISLRNAVQIFVGRIRVVPCPTYLYGPLLSNYEYATLTGSENIEYHRVITGESIRHSHVFIRDRFQEPTISIIRAMITALTYLHDFTEYIKSPVPDISSTGSGETSKHADALHETIKSIRVCQSVLENLSEHLLSSAEMRGIQVEWRATPVVNVLVFVHYLYDMSRSLTHVLDAFLELAIKNRKWVVSFPSYPFARALKTNTRQITHDRGGQSAFYFFHTKTSVERVLKKIRELNTARMTKKHEEEAHYYHNSRFDNKSANTNTSNITSENPIHAQSLLYKSNEQHKFRYKVWKVVHRLQEYESRFAIRTALTVTLLSVPGWVSSSTHWYNYYDLWIAPIVALLVLHPRVGGNIHDLFVRTALALLGTVWGGVTYRARYGNPYVMAVMCAVFMVPAFFRFVISPHPRSGLLACISFTFTSLSMYVNGLDGDIRIVETAWSQGCAVIVGVAASTVISWIFWPFVARKEVRKGMGIVLSQLSQCYQSVTDRYLYKDEGNDPTSLTLSLSEIREARMRTSMDAYGDLIAMTQHEPSLEDSGHPGSFDPIPYQWLLKSARVVLQKVSEARISAIYFNVYRYSDRDIETQMTLMSLRRDAVASVIFLLYMLSSAFTSNNKVLSHMPSPAMSRKLLFDGMAEIERMSRERAEAALATRRQKAVRDMSNSEQNSSDSNIERDGGKTTTITAEDTHGQDPRQTHVKFLDVDKYATKETKKRKENNDEKGKGGGSTAPAPAVIVGVGAREGVTERDVQLASLRQKAAISQMKDEREKRQRLGFVEDIIEADKPKLKVRNKKVRISDGHEATNTSLSGDTANTNDIFNSIANDTISNDNVLDTDNAGKPGSLGSDPSPLTQVSMGAEAKPSTKAVHLPMAPPQTAINTPQRSNSPAPPSISVTAADTLDGKDENNVNVGPIESTESGTVEIPNKRVPLAPRASRASESSATETTGLNQKGNRMMPTMPTFAVTQDSNQELESNEKSELNVLNAQDNDTRPSNSNLSSNTHLHTHPNHSFSKNSLLLSPSITTTTGTPLPPHTSVLEKSQYIWALVHETTFSQTFTEIAHELEKLVAYSKYVLGEEEIWSDKGGGAGGGFGQVF